MQDSGPAKLLTREALLGWLLLGLCIAYFALWACAPMAAVPPMLPRNQGEISRLDLAVGGTTWNVGDGSSTSTPPRTTSIQGQVSYLAQFKYADIGGLLTVGNFSYAGVGVFTRFHLVDMENFQLGLQLSGGWLFAAAALPVSVRLEDLPVWVYTAPSYGMQAGAMRLPLGVAWRATEGLDWFLEGGAMSMTTAGIQGADWAPYGAFGVGHRF